VGVYEALERSSALFTASGSLYDCSPQLRTYSEALEALVDDVEPDLLSVPHIVDKLSQFQRAYPTEYSAAYIAESAAELLAMLVHVDFTALLLQVFRPPPSVSAAAGGQEGSNGGADCRLSLSARPWFGGLARFIELTRNAKLPDKGESSSSSKAPVATGMMAAAAASMAAAAGRGGGMGAASSIEDEEDAEAAVAPIKSKVGLLSRRNLQCFLPFSFLSSSVFVKILLCFISFLYRYTS
jgi:hypothetical protein